MSQVKSQEILNSLQNCYKISIQNEYEKIQEDLLSAIVDFKGLLNSGINLESNRENREYKDFKDYTKFNIIFKLTGKSLSNLPKTIIPKEVFKYLIENNLFSEYHFHFFSKNNFGRGFASKTGDLIFHYEQDNEVKRYTEFRVNNKIYFACNQWTKPTIDEFNNHINKEFSKYIEIVAVG